MVKAVFVIIGTAIGAGFASGQEIYSFFNIYEENGLIGIAISSLLTGLIIYNVLKKSNEFNINSYSELLEKIKFPKRLIKIVNIIINIFLLISFYIMVAGFTAYFKQEFYIPNILTAIIILILCYITFMKSIIGIARVNSIIIPILLIIILTIGYKANIIETMKNIDIENIEINMNWIIKSIEYASYNSILLIPILISIRKYAQYNERKISIITTIIFLILLMIIYFIMFKFNTIANVEIPLVYIASKYGLVFKYIYGIVVIFAIYTTMISAGYGFLQNCSNNQKKYKNLAIIICISALFISSFSFANLINLTYNVFGILGITQLIYIIK